jgi:hypothetical protein
VSESVTLEVRVSVSESITLEVRVRVTELITLEVRVRVSESISLELRVRVRHVHVHVGGDRQVCFCACIRKMGFDWPDLTGS